ncbi:hypothetical protein DAI22_05g223800 [Oryza sativa Japonica Group]|nr:hypothetical protein DAI22_05g223800 [Oryza sativa Japonica Group]
MALLIGHVQRVFLPRLCDVFYAKNPPVESSDGSCVLSRGDGDDPCSEAEEASSAPLYELVVPRRRRGRIPRGERARGKFPREIQVGRRREAHLRPRMRRRQPQLVWKRHSTI